MLNRSVGSVILPSLVLLLAVVSGCRREPVATTPLPPPPPPAAPAARPTVTLQANPTVIQSGQPAMLSWSSTNATSLMLSPGAGTVAAQGSLSVSPAQSTTYDITATGPGGTASANVRVTVTPGPPPAPTTAQPTIEELFTREVQDAYFDYDSAEIRPDARNALSSTAQFLRSYPDIRVVLEGHCDERGSTEYNLALGDRRAEGARQFLVSLGVPADRIQTVSYGKERPGCTDSNEACWQRNRRAHFARAR